MKVVNPLEIARSIAVSNACLTVCSSCRSFPGLCPVKQHRFVLFSASVMLITRPMDFFFSQTLMETSNVLCMQSVERYHQHLYCRERFPRARHHVRPPLTDNHSIFLLISLNYSIVNKGNEAPLPPKSLKISNSFAISIDYISLKNAIELSIGGD